MTCPNTLALDVAFSLTSYVFPSTPREKSIKTIQDEIRSVIRQVTATVTFLPLLETPCEKPHSFLFYQLTNLGLSFG